MKSFSVFILTFNDELMIGRLLDDLADVEKVVVIDSGSTDGTLDLCKERGRPVYYKKFINQAIQSNWAIENFFSVGEWVLRFDSDERASREFSAGN